jgi:hypothetical protein
MMIVGATADQLAKPIECELRGVPFTTDIEPRDELQWDATIFALHVLDRWALSRLGFAGRELAVGGVQASITEQLDAAAEKSVRDGFNEVQRRYGEYSALLPRKGDNLKGTFCWEFAKGLVSTFAPDHLGKLPIFAIATADAALFLFKCCDQLSAN